MGPNYDTEECSMGNRVALFPTPMRSAGYDSNGQGRLRT